MGSNQPQKLPAPKAQPSHPFTSGIKMREQLNNNAMTLSAPVGPGAPNRPDDVLQLERVLQGAGLLKRAAANQFDKDTAAAISEGQKKLNRDYAIVGSDEPLKVDGLINPDGPTQSATRELARRVTEQWNNHNIDAPNDELTANDNAEINRLADSLSNSSTPGPIASDISSAINQDGEKAIMEYKILRQRLAEKAAPYQVEALDSAVLNALPTKMQSKVQTVIQPDQAPETDSADYRLGAHERLRKRGINAAPKEWKKLQLKNAAAAQHLKNERELDRAKRDELNSPLPGSADEAKKSGFELLSPMKSKYHQNLRGKLEQKFIHPDGREVVFDGDTGEVVTDPKIKGTYNYGPNPNSPTHWIKDIWPHIRLSENPIITEEHRHRAKLDARKKAKSIRKRFSF